MKKLFTLCGAMLLHGGQARSSVEVLNFQPCAQNAVITMLKDGALQKNVDIDLYIPGEQPKVKLTTDETGAVRLPTLKPAGYCLRAWVGFELEANICLAVSNEKEMPSSFTVNLAATSAHLFEVSVQAAESRPPSAHVKEFSGVVRDPTGTAIPRAVIAVGPVGDRKESHAKKVTSDESGRFSLGLKRGVYTALFEAPGFQTRVLVFELSSSGSSENLQIKMDIGECSE